MILALTGFWLVAVSVIVFIFIIGLIIVVHEFGHFLVARKSGIFCHEFSIGMGPCIYKHQFKNTLFCLRAIPIGGYVQMADDEVSDFLDKGKIYALTLDEDEVIKIDTDSSAMCDIKGELVDFSLSNPDNEEMFITILADDNNEYTYRIREKAVFAASKSTNLKIPNYKETFSSKPIYKRMLTLLAGPVMNFILAIIIYLIYFCIIGVPNYDSNVIGEVSYGYAASEYLKPGDRVTSVEGVKVNTWNEFSNELDKQRANLSESVELGIIRVDGKEENIVVNYSIIINSIGLSNLQIENDNPQVNGVVVGNVALNYLNDNANPEYALSNGDIITKIRIDTYITSSNHQIGEVIDVTSWHQLLTLLNEVDVAEIRFEYYDLEKAAATPDNPYVSIDECAPLITWGNETLNAQSIEKIQLLIGVSPVYHFDLGGIIVEAFRGFWSDFTLVFRTLKIMIAPSGIRQVGVSNLTSVVGIFDMVLDLVSVGFLPVIAFAAMLSVNIGIMNLLPIPALDGGRIVFLLYELITGKRPNKTFENILTLIFIILLFILLIFVTYNDILRF